MNRLKSDICPPSSEIAPIGSVWTEDGLSRWQVKKYLSPSVCLLINVDNGQKQRGVVAIEGAGDIAIIKEMLPWNDRMMGPFRFPPGQVAQDCGESGS